MKTAGRVLLVLVLLMMGALSGAPGAAAQEIPGSAVTVAGKGAFANLKVTVSQTSELIGQVVKVSWTGGDPTPGTEFESNFLQIMQCWGDEPGPDRTQCQYGVTNRGNFNLGNRRLQQFRVDPQEQVFDPLEQANSLVFWPAGGTRPTALLDTGAANPYLDTQITNEVPFARSRPSGDGEAFFEVQTFRQSAGLDCGKAVTTGDVVRGKSCWLVIVPRNQTDVDGLANTRLESSPLSKTNWDQRLQVELDFLPVDQACPLGAAERPIRGHEPVLEAISRWQPALCAGGGSIFSYTQFTDDLARNDVLGGNPGVLDIVANPADPEQVLPSRPVVYAPVALAGTAIAFSVDRQALGRVEDPLNGARFEEMNLTPRLVAKLLTQSYRDANSGAGDPLQTTFLAGNPSSLTRDEEFLKYNPLYRDRDSTNRPVEALVQISVADSTSQLWSWVLGDADARAFVTGTADESGMVVNPANAGLTAPVPNFPRNDQSCNLIPLPGTDGVRLCTSDERQYANDMHQAARSASRGDTLGRTPSSINDVTKRISFVANPRQPPGKSGLLAVADAASAARYGLPTARLAKASPQLNAVRDVGRDFVAPTTESLLAGLAAMKPSAVPGVLQPDPLTTDPAAYPLTFLSYAATAPSAITREAGTDYATFLDYAVGPGQTPGLAAGSLPVGYAPLPEALRAQTRAAAATIKAQAGIPIVGETIPTDTPTGTNTTGSGTTGTTTGGATASGSGSPAAARTAAAPLSPAAAAGVGSIPGLGAAVPPAPVAGAPAPAAPVGAAEPAAVVRRTPGLPAPAGVGALLIALLVCGGLAAVLAPLAHYVGAGRSTPAPGPDDQTGKQVAVRGGGLSHAN